MDPISALSLVANVFAVVGFAGQCIQLSLHIHERGTIDELSQLESVSAKSKTACSLLRDEWHAARTKRSDILNSLDPQLDFLAKEVIHAADNLQLLLEELQARTKADGTVSLPAAIVTTFKVIWKKDRIVRIQERLVSARDELQFYLIVLVKTNLDQYTRDAKARDRILKSLDQSTRDGLRKAAVSLQSLGGKADDVLAGQQMGEASAQQRHEELLRFISSLSINQLAEDPRSSRQVDSMFNFIGDTRKGTVNAVIVSSLWFPTMQDREDSISKAHEKTYSWIYQEPKAGSHQSWDNFGQFLRSSSGLYWITGKPGAGKSTLVKFVNRNDKTNKGLSEWAGVRRMNVARFYFYYNGTKMQKSEVGVLRSLLHQILERRPSLVKHCFPDRYRMFCFAPDEPQTFSPTVWELKRALRMLVESQKNECFFFSVDGLDEYDADDTEMALLAKVFDEFSTLPNVKSLLSSRPLQTFEKAFDKFPRLRLHELTRPDITAFVMGNISRHPALERLMGGDKETSRKFIDEIVESSSGVFLWVHLVVRSLLIGLQNFDDVSDLYRRLRELPSDLEELYRHMWAKIPPMYRGQASRLLQLVETATKDGGRLSVTGLSFADESDPRIVHNLPVAQLKEDEVKLRYERTQGRIASRCMGLVEIEQLAFAPSPLNSGGNCNTDLYDNALDYSRYKYPNVRFIHRTISEFISNPEIHKQLRDTTPGFAAEASLFSAAVCRIKTYHFTGLRPEGLPKSLEALTYYALNMAVRAENSGAEGRTEVLRELDETLTRHVEDFLPTHGGHWADLLYELGDIAGWSSAQSLRHNSLLTVAVRYGLLQYVQEEVDRDPPILLREGGRPILDYALRPYCHNARLPGLEFTRKAEMVQLLLSNGCNPNVVSGRESLWVKFLQTLVEDAKRDANYFLTTPEVLTALLEAGASPHVDIWVEDLSRPERDVRGDTAQGLLTKMGMYPKAYGVAPANWLGFKGAMLDVVALIPKLDAARLQSSSPRAVASSEEDSDDWSSSNRRQPGLFDRMRQRKEAQRRDAYWTQTREQEDQRARELQALYSGASLQQETTDPDELHSSKPGVSVGSRRTAGRGGRMTRIRRRIAELLRR